MLKNWKILLVLTISLSVIIAFQNCARIKPVTQPTQSQAAPDNSDVIDPAANEAQDL